MTAELKAALGAHYRRAIINSDPAGAVVELANTLRGNDELIAEATAEQQRLTAFGKPMGGVDRLKNRDFVSATHLKGLTEALERL